MSKALKYARQLAEKKPERKVDMFARLMYLEEVLAKRGFHPMSPWWKQVFKTFYSYSSRKRLVIRAGRRGGKSSTLCRVAVCELLWGNHKLPSGDIGVFAFVSITRKEARARLETVAQILDALGVKYRRRTDEIQVYGKPFVFRVYSCSFRTAVGFTCIGMVGDEVARWRDDETGANPATEVLRSMRPAMATMPNAKEFLCSSPWSTLDAHYDAFEVGTNEVQQVAKAATWVANPSLSEERCRELEPDEESFNREYGAMPMRSGASTFFDPVAIDLAVDENLFLPREARDGEEIVAGGDFGFRSDFSGLCVAHITGGMYSVAQLVELRPQPGSPLRPSFVCKEYAKVLRQQGCSALMADHHYRESVVEHLANAHLGFIDAPKQPDKVFVRARTLLNQGRVRLPGGDHRLHKQLVRDLNSVQSRPTASGGLSIIMPRKSGGGHCDLVSALVLALWQKAGRRVTFDPTDAMTQMTKAEREEVEGYERYLRSQQNPYDEQSSYTEQNWITHL